MTEQITLFDYLASLPKFHGKTFNDKHDKHRLESQYMRVFNLMLDGRWRTLADIRAVTGGSEAGISARLRDFRKLENGSHRVESRRRGEPADGLHEYRLCQSHVRA